MKRLLGLLLCIGLLAFPALAQAEPPHTTITSVNWGDDDSKIVLSYVNDDPSAEVECQVDEKPWFPCDEERSGFYWFEIWPEYTQGHWFRIRGVNADGPELEPPGYYRE